MRSLFYTKPVEELAQRQTPGLQRSLTAWDLTLLGIGCIMGTGIFVLTGQAAANFAGPAVVVSFVLAALCAALGAVCYAEMAAMIPVSGSAYLYAYATLGELAAFCIGWNLALQYLVGAATVAIGWSGYIGALLQHIGLNQLPGALLQAPCAWDASRARFVATGAICNAPAAAIILGLCVVLVRGLRESARLNTIIVAVKMAVVVLFLVFSVPHIRPEFWHPFVPANTGTFGHFGLSGVLQAATLLFFAYLGFDAVSVAAGETQKPQTDVPIGILASLGICAALYVAVALALTGLVPYTQLGVAHPMAVGVEAIGLPWLITVVNVGAIAGLSSVLLVQLFALPRILLAMAQDQFLPRALARVHQRFHTPARLTWLCGLLCSTCAALLPIDVLAELTSVGTLVIFAAVSMGVTALRFKRPDLQRRFKVPGGPFLVPGLCVASCTALMTTASWASIRNLSVWLFLGGITFAAGRKARAKPE